MAELAALAKKDPGKYSYASMSIGFGQLTAERFFKLGMKIDMIRVPFQGAAPLISSTMGNHTPVAFIAQPPTTPLIKEGKLRALAVTGKTRSPDLPDVPTTAEAGVPGQESDLLLGLVAPAGTPKPIVDLLQKEVVRLVALPDVAEKLEDSRLHAGCQHVRGLCGADQVRPRGLEQGREGARHHGAVRQRDQALPRQRLRADRVERSPGVEALVSTLRWISAGLPDFSQALKAAAKSAVFSTVTPKPPNALA